MDFFGAEQRAKKRTTRLLVLFGFAVAGTVAVGYLATVVALHVASVNAYGRAGYGARGGEAPQLEFWQPGLLAVVSVCTVAVIGLASLYKWSEYSGGGAAVAESVGGRRI